MDPARPLLDVQELDTAIDRLAARIRALEAGEDASAALAEANEAERLLGELRLQLDELSRDQTRFEHEIDSMAGRPPRSDASTTARSRTPASWTRSGTRSTT